MQSLPETPGVYFMKDAKGRTLYIGKAKNLRNRVVTYFHDSYGDPRIRTMVSKVEDIEILHAPSEVDALLMEARLIKDIQPRYNDRLKDDKSFTMLAITQFDDYPKVWVVRETDELNAETYGPFTSAGELRDAVRVLQKIFRFATCSIEMRESDPKRRFFRPCLLHAIGRCSAPCADRISRDRYRADVEMLRRFLGGGRDEVVAQLRVRMKEASKGLEFERAAELRDQIKALEGLSKRSELDYLEGDITPMDPREGLEELGRVLGLPGPPRAIEGVDIAHVQWLLIDGGVGQLNSARAALAELGVSPPVLLSLAKEEETLFRDGKPLRLPKSSPALRLMMYVRDEAHRFAQHYHHQLRRKALIE
ncbi:MAG: UvrB/UvrC motif-containing protein [Planctomycetes bacterium]|nr:UvrB/UvrC motif-containing protein [Planctomycetota bacterium]